MGARERARQEEVRDREEMWRKGDRQAEIMNERVSECERERERGGRIGERKRWRREESSRDEVK